MKTLEPQTVSRRIILQQETLPIVRIETRFDMDALKKFVNYCRRSDVLKKKNGQDLYRVASLQSDELGAEGNDTRREYFETLRFDRVNELGSRVQFVFDAFPGISLRRGRILEALPGFYLPTHVDGHESRRIHVPIETASEASLKIEGVDYHLPADGSSYLVDTSRRHSMQNASHEVRTHLVFEAVTTFLPGPLAENEYRKIASLSGNEAAEYLFLFSELSQEKGAVCWFCNHKDVNLRAYFFAEDDAVWASHSWWSSRGVLRCEGCAEIQAKKTS